MKQILIIFAFIISCSFENTIAQLKTLTEPITGIEFVQIPNGSFIMGDNENTESKLNSNVLHKVVISKNFWLSKTEVTQLQWGKIMGNKEIHPEKPSPFRNTNPQYPVVSISYYDVQEFLVRLNKLSKIYHFRLPTEAEWEYACRAGTNSTFSYGPILTDSLANIKTNIQSKYSTYGKYLARPAPVGSYPANQWGLYDMHGNVWEWVSDWYGPYPNNEVTDPTGPPSGKQKVIRGGSWYFEAENARSSARRTHEPNTWGFSIGFRIVCEKRNNN